MKTTTWLSLTMVALIGCGSSQEEGGDELPRTCDSGDEAFVQRVMPLIWGRRPHGAHEVKAWAEMARTYGRVVVVSAMTRDQAYVDRWSDWITDTLLIARTGDRSYAACFGNPMIHQEQGELARYIAQTPALLGQYREPFNMADVVRSSVLADDLSAAWRVNLFARMNRPVTGANVGPREMEENRRTAFGDEFYSAYLNRNLTCLPCHNSEYSVTGDEDPAKDHTWEVTGLFEKAILGSSYGLESDSAYQPFRYSDLMDKDTASVSPWGLAITCGLFTPPDQMNTDYLGQEGYLIQPLGEAGSVWHVETYLSEGIDNLQQHGLIRGEYMKVDGPDALAWLLGMSIVDQVWLEATGARLTIANNFPRNEGQKLRLEELTNTFVQSRFSLRNLLVEITQDDYYNQGSPSQCQADPYGMDPIYHAWSPSEEDPKQRGNGPGDQVHRQTARTLIRSVHDSLGWAQPSSFLAYGDPMAVLQTNLGAFMRTSQPGFNGTDFQGALAFEGAYGACAKPSTGGAGDGCRVTPGYGGCASCGCQSCVCALDEYCCDVQWDSVCVSLCNDSCGGCGGGLAAPLDDYVTRLLAGAITQGATVGDLVLALKDRLVAQGQVGEEERVLMEQLLASQFSTPVSDSPALESALRVLCGALLLSPDYFLAVDPLPVPASPRLALDKEKDCQRVMQLMAAEGITTTCPGESL